MVNLELYRAFYTVAKTGSLTSASRELFVSQPALSQSIRQLEAQLGGRLFMRSRKGMELTGEGRMVFEYVERAMSLLRSAELNYEKMRNLLSGNIRIGASDTLCRHFLLPCIKLFHERYPHVGVQVTNRTSPETISLLKSGKVDIGFVNLPVNAPDCELTQVMNLNECFVAAPGGAFKGRVTEENISGLPLVLLETLSSTRVFIDGYFENLGIKLAPEFELGSFDLVLDFVKAGLGVGIVTREFLQRDLADGTLVELESDFDIPSRGIGALSLSGLPLSFAAQTFMDIVQNKTAAAAAV